MGICILSEGKTISINYKLLTIKHLKTCTFLEMFIPEQLKV